METFANLGKYRSATLRHWCCVSDPRAQVEIPEDWALAAMRRVDMDMKKHLLMKRCEQASSLGLSHTGGKSIDSAVQCSLLEISFCLISWLSHCYKCFSACFKQMSRVLLFFNAVITAWEDASCKARLTAVFRRPYESQCHHLQLVGQTEGKWFVQGVSKQR